MPDGCWNREREVVDRGEITGIRERRIRKQAEYDYQNAAYYGELFDEEGLSPAEIPRIDDCQRKVPFVFDFDTQELAALGKQDRLMYTNLDAAGTPYLWRQSKEKIQYSDDYVCDSEHFTGKILGRTGDRIQIDEHDVFPQLQTGELPDNATASVTERLESNVDVPVDVEPFDVDTGRAEWKPGRIVEEAI